MTASTLVLDWLIKKMTNMAQGKEPAELPGELEIAEQLGVGRSSVREAIAGLKVFGLLESKRRRGLKVVGDIRLLDLMYLFLNRDFKARDYIEVRQLRGYIELGSASEIIGHATPEDIQYLRKLLTMMSLKEDSPISSVEFEIRFHEKLAALSGNRFMLALSFVYKPLFEFQEKRLIPEHLSPIMPENVLKEHEEIVDSIECKDLERLRKALELQLVENLPELSD
jgi:DNA-binding FadR family transcriptional regulator